MIRERRRKIDDNIVKKVKEMASNGISINEAGRLARISYYSAWQIVNGGYDHDKRLCDVFQKPEKEQFFSWKNFSAY
jgi:hypothetical protein